MRIEYFQLIDRVESISEDPPRLVAEARVPDETTIFEGHFPGHPLMPGVLLIESMAQAAGYLLLSRNAFAQMPFLVGVKEAKLRSFVTPSSDLRVEAEVEHEGSGYAVSKTAIRHDGKLVCNAQLVMRIMPFPAPELLEHVRRQARLIGLPEPAKP